MRITLPERVWTLVRDKRTGHHYDTAHVDPEVHEVLAHQPAEGTPRPVKAKPHVRLPKSEPQTDDTSVSEVPADSAPEAVTTPHKRATSATKENKS